MYQEDPIGAGVLVAIIIYSHVDILLSSITPMICQHLSSVVLCMAFSKAIKSDILFICTK